ncbi:hypothetical protein ACI3PL_27495, partial [Lacticaseibacillus paracasei]
MALKLNKSPTTKDIDKDKSIPSSSYFHTVFQTQSWNEILTISGLELNHFQGYTEDNCLKSLIEFSKHLGKTPLRDD